jgi:hypothetical protein
MQFEAAIIADAMRFFVQSCNVEVNRPFSVAAQCRLLQTARLSAKNKRTFITVKHIRFHSSLIILAARLTTIASSQTATSSNLDRAFSNALRNPILTNSRME